ncbi:MAG: aminotransferase class I/II-fold pyridoxal phosphate-dependent enzyme, partial [Myxococcota bacterium]
IERLLKGVHSGVIVVLDEAYNEYVQDPAFRSALSMRGLREKLVVSRTFSKVYGLGGVRAGYAVGPAEMMTYLNRVREPFNCNTMAQVGAAAALGDEAFVRRSIEVNEASRALLESGLRELEEFGVTWTPSQTNFLLVRTPHEGAAVYHRMLRQGVIVRPMAGYGIVDSVRISMGTQQECRRCVDALRVALEGLAEAS